MKELVFNIAFLVFSLTLYSQNKTTVSGFIYDKNSGEVLIGATLMEKKTKTGTVSNEYGFYSLTVYSNDTLEIEVTYIGYKQLNIKTPANQNIHKDFNLTVSSITLDNVTIVASKEDNIVKRNETGVVRLPINDIKTLPNLFGEVDIVKAYQLTPGVQSGGEAKSELYVRGGSPDQNLILLDDVPIYYVAHFGGFFSVFNADAINDVKLIKGGFPARYGSRLSSVLDIRMKEGNMQKLSVQGTIGLLSSKLSIEAPVIKDKMSFIISARKNLLPIFKIMGTDLSYNFYDINAKLNYRLSKKDKLFLSYYMGDDNISMSEKTAISNNNTTVKWGNTLFAFRWNHVFNNKLFSNLTLSNTYYRYKNIFEYDVKTDSLSKRLSNSLLTGINDISLKLDFTYLVNANLNFRFGANSIYHTFIPNDEHFSQEGTGLVSTKENYSSSMNAIENSVYLENELKFNLISANMEFRYSSYHIGSTSYYSLEPG
ncbi:MAG: TonB-dependent receptor, partial [Bacteroidota bacterium]